MSPYSAKRQGRRLRVQRSITGDPMADLYLPGGRFALRFWRRPMWTWGYCSRRYNPLTLCFGFYGIALLRVYRGEP